MGAKVEKQEHFNKKITDIASQDLSSFFLIRTENVLNEWGKGKNLVGGLCRKKLAACCRILPLVSNYFKPDV